jgi:hypothetical protein
LNGWDELVRSDALENHEPFNCVGFLEPPGKWDRVRFEGVVNLLPIFDVGLKALVEPCAKFRIELYLSIQTLGSIRAPGK